MLLDQIKVSIEMQLLKESLPNMRAEAAGVVLKDMWPECILNISILMALGPHTVK